MNQQDKSSEELLEELQMLKVERDRMNLSFIQLTENEDMYKVAFTTSLNAYYIKSLENGNFIEVNPVFENLFGYKKNEIIGKTISQLSLFVNYQSMITKLKADGFIKDYEIQGVKKTGELVLLAISANIYKGYNNNFIIGALTDITSRKLAEEELNAAKEMAELNENKLKNLINAIPDLVWYKDLNGVYLECNTRFENFIGYSQEQLNGKTDFDLFDKDLATFFRDNDRIAIEAGRSVSNEELVTFANDGHIEYLETIKTPLYYNNHNLAGVLGIGRNISKRREHEAQIISQNKELQNLNSTKDKFFSIIAHDLKGPFNSIISLSEILSEQIKAKDYEGVEEYAEMINQASKRTMDLLTNLLDWSRVNTGRIEYIPEYFDMVELIDRVIPLYSDAAIKKSITLQKLMKPHLFMNGDKNMIFTVLRNLLSNAIKFTPNNGLVEILAEIENNNILVKFVDNGVGISKENLHKLFRIDENYTTPGTNKEKGTGLGLILCQEFIKMHGGEIWAESQLGQGTTFTFKIPV